jgi:hypothetical protein
MVSYRIYVIYHKFLTLEAYTELDRKYIKDHIQFVGVNGNIQKTIPSELAPYSFQERELPNFDPFMQANRFCESSVFFHVVRNEERLLKPYDFVGFLHYDMVINNKFFECIDSSIENSEKILFYHEKQWSVPHLNQVIGFQGWSLIISMYNTLFKTEHTLDEVLNGDLPLFHSYMMHKTIFARMMFFAHHSVPRIFEMLGYDTRHLPYHIERSHGIFLLLQKLDGHLTNWIELPGLDHKPELKDPWQS